MGRRLRQITKNAIYETVQGIVDRQFMFRPDHYSDIPTLSTMSPKNALDPGNDLTPIPSTLNIIGAAIGRALKEVPVNLYCFEVSVNHGHREESVDDSCCIGPKNCKWAGTPMCGVENHPARFSQRVNSVIAQQINKKYGREGHLFAAPERVTECVDAAQAEEKLFYAMTNTVKDGLVNKVSDSPFFSTYDFWTKEKPLSFWYIDWDAYYKAGGERKKNHRPKDYLCWVEWEPKVLPNWADSKIHKYSTFIRQNCRDIEAEQRSIRKQQGRSVMGIEALYKLDPRDRPKTPRKKTPQPLCHASDPKDRREYQVGWREFSSDHRKASWDYRMGNYEREFPEGSYRPPLICVYSSSYL